MTIPTFDPPMNPSFGSTEYQDIPADVIQMHTGIQQIRPLAIAPVQSLPFVWKRATREVKDYIVSFFRKMAGARGPFWYPVKVDTPEGAPPVLSQVSGGSLSERTYYVVYTWYDSVYGETMQSEQASLTVAANYYLTVAVPPFPLRAEGWRLYAHETSGSECLQDTITDARLWTQSAALSTGTATPPSSNTLEIPAKWFLTSPIKSTLLFPERWAISFEAAEYTI